jgi:hypothetical protein
MGKKGLSPIYQRPRTSDPHPQHQVYPYLLRKLAIDRPNHVWCADVTYIPMRRGFLYLVAMPIIRNNGPKPWISRQPPSSCRLQLLSLGIISRREKLVVFTISLLRVCALPTRPPFRPLPLPGSTEYVDVPHEEMQERHRN